MKKNVYNAFLIPKNHNNSMHPKPKPSQIDLFVEHIKANGPISAKDIEKSFKKHNELFLRAQSRGQPIKRYVMSAPRKFGLLGTWYYTKGQETELKARVVGMLKK